jgi:DUF1009 family protein
MSKCAIIAGRGSLPRIVAKAAPDALYVTFKGVDIAGLPTENPHSEQELEKLGALFATLHAQGITQVCFAGALNRADLDPSAFDARTMQLLPRIMGALQKGDDGLLREIVAIFAEEGFTAIGAHAIAPEITLTPGTVLGVQPDEAALADTERARAILTALSPVDVAQAAIVEGGICLGIESIQGTDALLRFAAQTPGHLRRGKGVLVKDAKQGQDLRVDMPTIGVETLEAAYEAGLAGIMVGAGRVIVLGQKEVERRAQALGLFVASF